MTTISELKEMMQDHLRGQQEDRIRFKEMEQMLSLKFQETDKRIREAFDLFTSQWGKLVESLVEGDLIRTLNERNIAVRRTLRRVEGRFGDTHFEFDIIAINGEEVVIVEVKTTLRPKNIRRFIEKLEKLIVVIFIISVFIDILIRSRMSPLLQTVNELLNFPGKKE